MTQQKRCPYRYYNHLVNNTSTNWDNQCKLDEGHSGEHIEKGMIVPVYTQTNPNIFRSGWVKIDQ